MLSSKHIFEVMAWIPASTRHRLVAAERPDERGCLRYVPTPIRGSPHRDLSCRCDKRPSVRGYPRIGLRASAELASKFADAPGLGIMCGERSRVTVLDVDTTDERVLADALSRHGPTPRLSARPAESGMRGTDTATNVGAFAHGNLAPSISSGPAVLSSRRPRPHSAAVTSSSTEVSMTSPACRVCAPSPPRFTMTWSPLCQMT